MTGRPRWRDGPIGRWSWTLGTATVLAFVVVAGGRWATTDATAAPNQVAEGRELFETTCATCHGSDLRGSGQGPSLLDEGPASVDFVLRTGRMPMPDPLQQPVRRPPEFDQEQIDALIAYISSVGATEPPIPEPDLEAGDVARGGEAFRVHCSTCHQAAASGGVLTGGRTVPSLAVSSPTDVQEALLIGPGAMPSFAGLDQTTIDDLTAYVAYLQQSEDPGGAPIGRVGPFAEGLVAWTVGLAALIVIARRVERRSWR